MASFDGRFVRVSVGGSFIVGAVSSSMNLSTNMIETTDYDGGGDASFLAGTRNATLSADFNLDRDGGNLTALTTAQAAGSSVAFIYGGDQVGDVIMSGTALINSIDVTASIDSSVNVSVSFQVTGSVTVANVT